MLQQYFITLPLQNEYGGDIQQKLSTINRITFFLEFLPQFTSSGATSFQFGKYANI